MNLLDLKPSADRVIILPNKVGELKTSGGIIIPVSAWKEYNTGTVLSVGPGPTGETGHCPMTSEVGDQVLFPPSLGRPVEITQEDDSQVIVYVIRQHEISVTLPKVNPHLGSELDTDRLAKTGEIKAPTRLKKLRP